MLVAVEVEYMKIFTEEYMKAKIVENWTATQRKRKINRKKENMKKYGKERKKSRKNGWKWTDERNKFDETRDFVLLQVTRLTPEQKE